MKKMNVTAVKNFTLALILRYYGFKPKSGDLCITEYEDDLSKIYFIVNGVDYVLTCETSVIKGIGFNGFKLDTLAINRLCGVYEDDDNDTENDTDNDTEE